MAGSVCFARKIIDLPKDAGDDIPANFSATQEIMEDANMRIVCYISSLSGGGAERVLSVLANNLSQRGHKVWMVTDYTSPSEYPLADSVERMVFDGEFDPARAGQKIRSLRRIFRLRRFCREKKAEIIISFMKYNNFRALAATFLTKTKSLISVRIDPKIGYRTKSSALVAKLLYPTAKGCVFQTDEAQAWFPEKIQRHSRVIFNPVSDTFFAVEPNPMAEKRIVTCGRLDEQKRFDLLINAFDKVCDDFPEYKLEIYGVGHLQETLQAQIDSLGRQDRIVMMGRSKDVPNAIKTASLFVLASDYEGLPNALMEAMVLGLPVVSTDCSGGGARALIENGTDGLMIPCGDVDALADAIRLNLADPEAAKLRGQKASEKAKGFSTGQIVTLWEQYIAEIVQGDKK